MCWMVRFMSVVQLPQGCYGARLHADDSEDQVQLHPGCHGSLQLLISLNFVKYLLPVRLPTVPLSRFSWQSLWESMIFFYDWFFISGLCGMCEEAIVGRGRCKTFSVEQHWLQHFQGLQLYSHFNPLADGIALKILFYFVSTLISSEWLTGFPTTKYFRLGGNQEVARWLIGKGWVIQGEGHVEPIELSLWKGSSWAGRGACLEEKGWRGWNLHTIDWLIQGGASNLLLTTRGSWF